MSISLDWDKIKEDFYRTMKEKASSFEQTPNYYSFHLWDRKMEQDWNGIDLSMLVVKAANKYEMWLKMDDLISSNSRNSMYELTNVEENIWEEMEDADDEITMEELVEEVFRIFEHNDSFWYTVKENSQAVENTLKLLQQNFTK